MKKMYYFTPFLTWAWGVIWGFANVLFLVLMLMASFSILGISLFLVASPFLGTVCLIKSGFFTQILVSEYGIKVRGKAYAWDDIRITAWPDGTRSIQYQYVLYFANEYLTLKRNRKSKSICKVYLNSRNLEIILSYYTKKICVMDPDERMRFEKPLTKKSVAQRIEEHNAHAQ